MRRITGRQRLLLGGLVVAVGVWLADSRTGDGQPQAAQAQSAATGQPAAAPVVWQDMGPLLDQLTTSGYVSVADRLQNLDRDLFMPTAKIETALGAATPTEDEVADAEAQPVVDRVAEFRERHRLVGVLLGGAGWAVIDGRLYPLRAELDGYRLVEIGRDRVVFADPGGGEPVVLELMTGGNPGEYPR